MLEGRQKRTKFFEAKFLAGNFFKEFLATKNFRFKF